MQSAAIVPLFSFTCIRCGETKATEEFRKNKLARLGHHSTCRACDRTKREQRLSEVDVLREKMSAVGVQKRCKICGEEKPIKRFSRCADSPDGSRHDCIDCSTARSRVWEKKITRKERLAVYRRHRLKKKYGLTEVAFQAMIRAQKNRCAVCYAEMKEEKDWRQAVVDHDHKTGKVRAILCHACNCGIGHFEESIRAMESAIAYLKKHARPD